MYTHPCWKNNYAFCRRSALIFSGPGSLRSSHTHRHFIHDLKALNWAQRSPGVTQHCKIKTSAGRFLAKWARGHRHRAGPAPGRGKAGLCWELPQGTRPLRHQILAGNGNFAAGEGQESFHEASLNTRAQVRGQKWDQAVCKSPFKARSPPPDVSASPLCFTAWRSKPVVTVGRLFFFLMERLSHFLEQLI